MTSLYKNVKFKEDLKEFMYKQKEEMKQRESQSGSDIMKKLKKSIVSGMGSKGQLTLNMDKLNTIQPLFHTFSRWIHGITVSHQIHHF